MEGQVRELVSIARAMAPRFGARAAQAEQQRRMPSESIREMTDSGLVKMMVPARFGGLELGYDALLDVTVELGRQCASTAWCFSFLACHGWIVGLFGDAAQEEVWAEGPNALIANQSTPLGKLERTGDGFVLTGTWPFTSGIDHCGWVGLGAMETTADGPVGHLCLLPKRDLTVEESWFTSGLRGSGSNTVHAQSVRIPRHRMILRKDMLEGRCPGGALPNAAPVYRLPLLAGFETALAAPVLAATSGALELCQNRVHNNRRASEGQLAVLHIHLGESAVELDAARELLRRDLAEGMTTLRAGKEVTLEHRARVRRDSAFAARTCNRIMARLMSMGGGSVIYESEPLQRAWRDVQAMSGHIVLGFDSAMEHAGRIDIGLKPNVESY